MAGDMITIIGAGPLGCHAARLLAEAGRTVRVLEEHSTIGKPVQCTGIVTQSISESVPLKKNFVVNRLKRVRIHSPDGSYAEIKNDDVVIDRTRFDQYLAEQAEKAGAKICLGKRVTALNRKNEKGMNLFMGRSILLPTGQQQLIAILPNIQLLTNTKQEEE